MGDLVTCRCVLTTREGAADELFLEANGVRVLPCRPKGEPCREGRPEWEYEERDGRLHLTPSMLCTATGFHTAYEWSVAFERKPAGIGAYDHFYALNPDLKQP